MSQKEKETTKISKDGMDARINIQVDVHASINLKNFVDKALMQTMIDARESNEPLIIVNAIPFQGDKIEKNIDRLRLDESLVAPIIFRKKPITY